MDRIFGPPSTAASVRVDQAGTPGTAESVIDFAVTEDITATVTNTPGVKNLVTIGRTSGSATAQWTVNPSQLNKLGFNYNPLIWSGTGTAPAANVRHFIKMPWLATNTISNVHFILTQVGTGAAPVNVFVGVGTISGGNVTKIGTSADIAATVSGAGTTGEKIIPLVADSAGTLTNVAGSSTTLIYAEFVIGTQAGTNSVNLARQSATANLTQGALVAADGFWFGFAGAGPTLGAAGAVVAQSAMTVGDKSFWFGLS